jgi:ABC-type transporter Mla subunit MlaD
MSETQSTGINPAIEQVAQAAVNYPDAVTSAVQSSHATAAPTDPVEQRMAQIETFIQRWQPVLQMAETMLSTAVPETAPVISRVSQIETWADDLLNHFQHKIPALPPAAS